MPSRAARAAAGLRVRARRVGRRRHRVALRVWTACPESGHALGESPRSRASARARRERAAQRRPQGGRLLAQIGDGQRQLFDEARGDVIGEGGERLDREVEHAPRRRPGEEPSRVHTDRLDREILHGRRRRPRSCREPAHDGAQPIGRRRRGDHGVVRAARVGMVAARQRPQARADQFFGDVRRRARADGRLRVRSHSALGAGRLPVRGGAQRLAQVQRAATTRDTPRAARERRALVLAERHRVCGSVLIVGAAPVASHSSRPGATRARLAPSLATANPRVDGGLAPADASGRVARGRATGLCPRAPSSRASSARR